MKTLILSASALLLAGAGWVHSIPATMNPVNGWLIAMCAAAGMTLKALHQIEARE